MPVPRIVVHRLAKCAQTNNYTDCNLYKLKKKWCKILVRVRCMQIHVLRTQIFDIFKWLSIDLCLHCDIEGERRRHEMRDLVIFFPLCDSDLWIWLENYIELDEINNLRVYFLGSWQWESLFFFSTNPPCLFMRKLCSPFWLFTIASIWLESRSRMFDLTPHILAPWVEILTY